MTTILIEIALALVEPMDLCNNAFRQDIESKTCISMIIVTEWHPTRRHESRDHFGSGLKMGLDDCS